MMRIGEEKSSVITQINSFVNNGKIDIGDGRNGAVWQFRRVNRLVGGAVRYGIDRVQRLRITKSYGEVNDRH